MSSLMEQDIPTLMVGDFNCIYRSQEKMGGKVFVDCAEVMEFRNFLKKNGSHLFSPSVLRVELRYEAHFLS